MSTDTQPSFDVSPASARAIPVGRTDASSTASELDDAEVLQASIKAGSVAQIVVAAVAILGLIYLLKLVLITTLTSLLLAFVLEPLVNYLHRIGLPRWAGALLGVVVMVVLAIVLTFFFYTRAVDFATALPKYSGKIQESLGNQAFHAGRNSDPSRFAGYSSAECLIHPSVGFRAQSPHDNSRTFSPPIDALFLL